MKNEILWNTDIFADMISSNEKIISLCEEVKGALPGFSCLSECGLFTEGLSSIESMTSSLEDSVNGLSQMVKQHNESIASRESKIESLYRDTPFVSLGNVKNFKDYAMGSVPFLVAGAASKYSNAESFAQDRYYRMKEEQTKDPQFSSGIYEKAQAKDRYYRMKEEQTKDPQFSSGIYEKAQAKDRYYRMKEEQTRDPQFSSGIYEKAQAKDRYYRMKEEQTKDPQFSSEVQEKAQAKDRYDKMKVLYSEVNSTPSSKSTSTVMTYEEYKKGAQKFAQEHGLPEMSDSEMKESYTSYITKQPIIPKTEMKSMPEREVSTPIQEQNTKNNDLSQDRYYRMKAEQTKEQPFSSETFEKAQAKDRYYRMKEEQTRDPQFSSETFEKAQAEDRYYRMKEEQTKDPQFSSGIYEKAQAKDRYDRIKEEQTRDPQFSSETFEKAQAEDRYYRMKEEQTKDPQFSSEAFEKAKIEREQKAQAARRHSFDESTRDTGLADNTNNNVKPSIPEDKYTNNNNSYNNNQDFSSTKNSSDLFNDSENPSKPNDNIDKNYSNEFDYSKDLNQPTKSYEESQTTIEQIKNNSYQPNDIFVNRNQNNYSTKTTEDIINDISSKDDSIISNTQNNNVIKENNNNYDFKNDNNLNAEVQEQYHENNKNDDWLNGIAGVGVAGLGAFGLNNLLKNKHKKSENDTEDDDE